MNKMIRFADSPLLDAMRDAARDVMMARQMHPESLIAQALLVDTLAAEDARPSYRAAMRTVWQ